MASPALTPPRLRRTEGWELRFSAFLRVRARAPFTYGENDCLLFCADAVACITGHDFAIGRRGYDENAARDMLAENSLLDRIDAALGPSHGNVLMARRGDVVAMKLENGWTAAVVDDSGSRIAAVMPKGLTRLPLGKARRVWSY